MSSVELSKKYSNFSNVFEKVHADKLPAYSEHDLAIKTEKDKRLPFGLVHDLSCLKLEVLHRYKEMIAKRFIVPSKLPSKAPILFTKKMKNSNCA